MFCKEQVAQLRGRIDDIRASGAELVVIGNGTPEQAGWFVEDLGIDFPVYTDPERETFRAIGARRSLKNVLDPRTFVRSARAFLSGHRQSSAMGDGLQLGGVIVVRPDGSVPYRYLSRHPGDHPEVEDILAALESSAAETTSSS